MIELSYKYSTLDKEHQFGLLNSGTPNVYYQWVWFYLGRHLKNKVRLLPYSLTGYWKGEIIGEYKMCTLADITAKQIVKQINKTINENTKNETHRKQLANQMRALVPASIPRA